MAHVHPKQRACLEEFHKGSHYSVKSNVYYKGPIDISKTYKEVEYDLPRAAAFEGQRVRT